MTLAEIEVIYNLAFIIILIVVCALFCLIQIVLYNKYSGKRWLSQTAQFFIIVMITIFVWRVIIPMITKVPI